MSWQRTLAATAHITMHPAQLVGKQRPMTDYRNHRTYTPTKTLKAQGITGSIRRGTPAQVAARME